MRRRSSREPRDDTVRRPRALTHLADRPAWLAADGLQEAVLSVFDIERIARAMRAG